MGPTEGNDENKDSTDFDDIELELLKDHYISLREETHLRIELQNKRLTRGVTVIGAILGYGLLSGNHSVIVVTPFILGVLYIESARMYRQVGALASQMYEIEEELQDVVPLFEWEHKYGGFYGVSEGLIDVSWYRIPTYGLILVSIIAYGALMLVSVRFWPPEFGSWYISGELLVLLMIMYGLIIGGVWYAAHQYITNHLPISSS